MAEQEKTEQEKARLAELEAARARSGRNLAEGERDAVVGLAVNEMAHRADAEEAKARADLRTIEAESRTRTMAASASLSRNEANNERAAASNATFSATLVTILLAALVLAVGGYFMWWQPNHTAPVLSNTIIQRTEKTTERTSVPTVVEPPAVNVRVVTPTPAPPVDETKATTGDEPRAAPVDEPKATPENPPAPDASGGTAHSSDGTEGSTSGK